MSWADRAARSMLHPGNPRPKSQDRRAVGAGVAGLSAAQRLKDIGYRHITIYEKRERIGGKVLSYHHKGRVYELGPIRSSGQYKTINKLAKRFKQNVGVTLPDIMEQGRIFQLPPLLPDALRPTSDDAGVLSPPYDLFQVSNHREAKTRGSRSRAAAELPASFPEEKALSRFARLRPPSFPAAAMAISSPRRHCRA